MIVCAKLPGTNPRSPNLIAEEKTVLPTLERLKQLFVDKFDFKIEELKPTTTLEELGLDSLDMIEFSFDIEDEFNIRIPDKEFKVTNIQEILDAVKRFVSEQSAAAPSHS